MIRISCPILVRKIAAICIRCKVGSQYLDPDLSSDNSYIDAKEIICIPLSPPSNK